MFARRVPPFAALALGAALLAPACKSDVGTGDTIPATRGAYQPPGGGSPIDSDTACSTITDAEDAQRTTLGCSPVKRAACPGYLRAAGSSACFDVDQATVTACVDFIKSYDTCDDFVDERCIVSTIDKSCASGGTGGSGGAAGASGASGSGGTAGASGASGSGGTAGAAGASGAAGSAGASGAAGADAGTSDAASD